MLGRRMVRISGIGGMEDSAFREKEAHQQTRAVVWNRGRVSSSRTMRRWFVTAAVFWGISAGCSSSHLPRAQGVEPTQQVDDGRLSLGEMRLQASVCNGIDVKPEYATLDEQSIVKFLKARGLPVRMERARADLFYVELQVNPETDEWARLRVAVLQSPVQAGRELHDAVLQHGPGSWGIHRANLAVLGPIGSVPDIIAFVGKTKLSCWGVLTVAGRDDSFVVPGNYREL